MKFIESGNFHRILGVLVLLLLSAVSGRTAESFNRHDLAPDRPFPTIALPPIDPGTAPVLHDVLGKKEKMMLHLFASW